MKTIFEQGEFSSYSRVNLNESRSIISKKYPYDIHQTTIFISHKHEDLEDLKGVLGFLQTTYNVKVYIDSKDPKMPKITSAETALNIRERIRMCDKFILLATNSAIESKWCNWELGYGDAQKYKDHLALFPIKPKRTYDFAYKGSEYMAIYPYIFFEGIGTYVNGKYITRGYYVQTHEKGTTSIISLGEWLNRR